MFDFVSEVRPRTVIPQGFVAECRPSSRHIRHSGHSAYYSIPQKYKEKPMPMKANDEKELEMALNDVLSKTASSTEQLTKVINGTVVKLINTLLKGHRVSRICGSINVCYGDDDRSVTVDLNENYTREVGRDFHCSEFENEPKLKTKATSPPRSPVMEGRTCGEEFAHFGHYSPPTGTYEGSSPRTSPTFLEDRELRGAFIGRKPEVSERLDSEEESGYFDSERESVSDSCTEDMSHTPERVTIDDRNSPSRCEEDEGQEYSTCEDMESEDCRLVIDLSVQSAERKKTDRCVEIRDTCGMEREARLCLNAENEENKPVSLGCKNEQEIVDKEIIYTNSSRGSDGKMASGDLESSTEVLSSPVTDAPIDLSGDYDMNGNASPTDETESASELACKKCPAIHSDKKKYQEHVLKAHQQYACSTCLKDFSSKNNLKRHVRIHTGSRPYKCGQCDMSFARRDDLKGHTLKHDYNKPFRCSLCRKGYTDRACVKNHMSRAHCSRLMHICPQCGESFDLDEAFLEHKKSHPSLKQFSCQTCPFVGTNHLMAMKHQLLHSHKLFSCKPCNAYFSDPFGYTKHIRKHKKDADYTFYVCCFCDIVLPTYDQFVRHEYSHAQGKLHECDTCKKQFRSKTLMLEHSLAHSTVENMNQFDVVSNEDGEKSAAMVVNTQDESSTKAHIAETHCSSPERQEIHSEVVAPLPTPMEDDIRSPPFEGKLLDLSLKQPASGTDYNFANNSSKADSPSNGLSSLSNNCVPRNGCAAIETYNTMQGQSAIDCSLAGNRISTHDEEYQVVWKSSNLSQIDEQVDNEKSITEKQLSHSPQMIHERHGSFSSTSQAMETIPRQIEKRNTRYSPYDSRTVDFYSKFVAARGGISKQMENVQMKKNKVMKAVSSYVSQINIARNNRNIPNTMLKTNAAIETNISPLSRECSTTQTEVSPRSMVYGLTGTPCTPLPVNFYDEPNKRKTGKISPALKQEILDDCLPSPTHKDLPVKQRIMGNRDRPMKPVVSSRSGGEQQCEICQISFASFSELESHSVCNHNRYLCEFCGKGFTARPNRDRHVRYHTGERPYKCDLCPSAFFRGDDLKYHRTTRHPTEQISCSKCSASFTWRKDLERHMRHSKCVA